ncbi:hypothetical protein NN561_010250 [Cricetulus griseus]
MRFLPKMQTKCSQERSRREPESEASTSGLVPASPYLHRTTTWMFLPFSSFFFQEELGWDTMTLVPKTCRPGGDSDAEGDQTPASNRPV